MIRTSFVEIFVDLPCSLPYDLVYFHLLKCLLGAAASPHNFREVEFSIWVSSVRELEFNDPRAVRILSRRGFE